MNRHLLNLLIVLFLSSLYIAGMAQEHPRIYVQNKDKSAFLKRMDRSQNVREFVHQMKEHLQPYIERHASDPEWIVSRLQMYWHSKYKKVYVNGMDFSHGEGSAPVPTVRFSGSRDWDTDYLKPEIEDVKPYMDDERGLFLQNGKKEGKPWEWVQPSETGHIIEGINKKILDLAQDAAFLYWLEQEEIYAVFATDIFMTYIRGMYHRDPPLTVDNHRNADLMGLQTFEVIHEGVIKPITLTYDFLYSYFLAKDQDLDMIQAVFRKWADQEIKYGVPGNNWNLMQARYITYLALALEGDESYEDGKGQEYYLDQVLNQNSRKQKALKDVMKNFDAETGIWPEVAHYSIMVSDDILEVFSLMDKSLDNYLLGVYPTLEKAILANFNYLFPNGFTTAYGDAKHARLRFRALELLIAQHRKYQNTGKEQQITAQLKRFMADQAYEREQIRSLFQLFYYVEELMDVPPANSFADLVGPTFYSPNVSWIVQRNGNSPANGMMISKNASLGNHSHANGINLELYAKGMVIAPDCAAGISYWSQDHKEYYSRFPAHNTVIVDGISDYRTMNSVHAFEVKSIYPLPDQTDVLMGNFTFSDVSFIEPATDARQRRVIGTVRTSENSGYFVDIFRSARQDAQDKKHEYLFHGQGKGLQLKDFNGAHIPVSSTEELSSKKGDLAGYDYFSNKKAVTSSNNFIAHFAMPSLLQKQVNVNLWMRGEEERTIFTVEAPMSRAIHAASVPASLYHQPLPTLVVRQKGEAEHRPFVSIIDVFGDEDPNKVEKVNYFYPSQSENSFVGITVASQNKRIDHLYNSTEDSATYQFADGLFEGTYGIVSSSEDTIKSLFLGSGKQLEKDSYKIVSLEEAGAILVEFDEKSLHVDANVSFRMRVPLQTSRKGHWELVSDSSSGSQVQVVGKLTKRGKERLWEFDIPALSNTELNIREMKN